MDADKGEKILLPHHEQMPLCTTRLPHRQGRKLTAVKVYTVNDESNHLLIFGVPSLNLRQETKSLFSKFGKLLNFSISKDHANEIFTETYHAVFERIQSARIAKRMLDTKNFFGGSLHVCYAPEMESLDETRKKLLQRRRDVSMRLKKNETETKDVPKEDIPSEINIEKPKLLNMGEANIIITTGNAKKRKIINNGKVFSKKFKSTKFSLVTSTSIDDTYNTSINIDSSKRNTDEKCDEINIEENINESSNNLNKNKIEISYSGFGKEIVKKIPEKPLNRIKFHIKKQ